MRTVCITVEVEVRYDLVVETDKTDEELQELIGDCRYMEDIEEELGGSFDENDTNEYPMTGYSNITEL